MKPARLINSPHRPHRRASIAAVPRWGPLNRTVGRSRAGVTRVFPGQPAEVAAARWWAAVLAGVRGADRADAGLVASELITNAIVHTRSGWPGGTITLAITTRPGWVTLHIHDLGADTGQHPTPRPASQDELAEGNRGLQIVTTLCAAWGTGPATCCPASRPSDPAAAAGGCCTWATLPRQPASTAASKERQTRLEQ